MPFKQFRHFLLFISIIVITSSCHLARSLIYLSPDHKDFKKFPLRTVAADTENFEWPIATTILNDTALKVPMKDGSRITLKDALENSKTNAFLVIKAGEIVYEQYYNGYHQHKTHTSFSISKAMLSTLLGIALDEGMIASLQDPITKYIPELLVNDSAFGKITIGHIYDMTSGINVRKKDASLMGDLGRTYYGNNWSRFMSTIEIESPPGDTFEYKQTDAQLLTLILSRVSGQNLSEFFSDRIWSKIGTEHEAYWNYYKQDTIERGFCCYNATPRDYAKFAYLHLNNGKWGEQQLVPEEWVNYSCKRTEMIESDEQFLFHHHWFVAPDGSSVSAQGYNGQFIYINSDKNLIILRFGKKRWKKVDIEDWLVDLARQIEEL